MLEDLQRQIRSLRAASIEELHRRSRAAESVSSAIGAIGDAARHVSGNSERRGQGSHNAMDLEDSEEDDALDIEMAATPESARDALDSRQFGLDERNYDERVGEGYHMRSLARQLPRTARALGRLHSSITPSLRPSTLMSRIPLRRSVRSVPSDLTARSIISGTPGTRHSVTSSRLSRVHSQLVSQMRATFRAMEMTPDLNRRGSSPLGDVKSNVSQLVMEKTEKEASVLITTSTDASQKSSKTAEADPQTSSATLTCQEAAKKPEGSNTSTKGELRALSQRLEKMLRDRREASAKNNSKSNCTHEDQENQDVDSLGLPRADKTLPLDPRKRWRHMYDGMALSCPGSRERRPSTHEDLHFLESSESGSESDLDGRGTSSGLTSRRSHWRPFEAAHSSSSTYERSARSSFHRFDNHRLTFRDRYHRVSVPRRHYLGTPLHNIPSRRPL